jgi:hypothetical protein
MFTGIPGSVGGRCENQKIGGMHDSIDEDSNLILPQRLHIWISGNAGLMKSAVLVKEKAIANTCRAGT